MQQRDVVVIAASRGGVEALCELGSTLSADFPGTLVAVQHISSTSPGFLATLIQRHTPLKVAYGQPGDQLRPGHFYLAPPDRHLIFSSSGLRLDDGPKVNHVRPAADPLFESAAAHFGPRVVGVVLTGGNGDGANGLVAIRKAGGISIVQHPSEAVAPSMPMTALNRDSPEFSVTIRELGPLLHALAEGKDGHEHLAAFVQGESPPAAPDMS
jgi:two-component system, chemotaxis family, protein-glutamate methylesterase/glutaminase